MTGDPDLVAQRRERAAFACPGGHRHSDVWRLLERWNEALGKCMAGAGR